MGNRHSLALLFYQLASEFKTPESASKIAVEVKKWGLDGTRYEFKDGSRIIYNNLLNAWDL